jgi:hypothetical protein
MMPDTYHTNFSKIILQRNCMDKSVYSDRKSGEPVATELISLG